MTSAHPYSNRSGRNFWKKTVSGRHPLDITEWYARKFPIGRSRIATGGSCFAQHIGRRLRLAGFRHVDAEPAPTTMREESRAAFGFGLYSARYGNIYTARQLRQLIERALGTFVPQEDCWRKGDGWVDPFRPTIEPPFASREELESSRQHHLQAVRQVLHEADVFVFTFGLTEAWVSTRDGAVFPLAPGVAGGEYDDRLHAFQQADYPQVLADMTAVIQRWREIRPGIRFIFTVSPVPLMATATEQQVVVASSRAKAVLVAVANTLAETFPFVDYFPAFEIVSSHVMRSQFYEPDMRSVAVHGVDHVMGIFFAQHQPPRRSRARPLPTAAEDTICDEELLANFGTAK